VYLYWRIQTDLDEIGSLLILGHPNLNREFEKWVRRNAGGLAISLDWPWDALQHGCPSRN